MNVINIDWYENPLAEGANDEKTLHPRLVLNGSLSTDEVIRQIHARSSLTAGDVESVLSNLADILGEALSDGKRVQLEGIGYFYPVIGAAGEVKANTPRRGEKVRLKSIRFKADKGLKKRFEVMHFHQVSESFHSDKLSDEEIDRLLTAYFADHSFLTRSKFQSLCGLMRTTAAMKLRQLREADKLENVGRRNQPIYVPKPGLYGKT
jgi:predicted histone-like DNA-binding protein